MSDMSGRRVLVLGLGVTGRSVARLLRGRGAEVLASDAGAIDEAEVSDLRADGVDVESGGHERAAGRLDAFDLVVPSPGISPHRGFLGEVVERGVPVVSELDLAAEAAGAGSIVAVTGTNGKTTVCTLAELIGRAAGLRAIACGNNEVPFSAAVVDNSDADMFVVEASSFALYFCRSFRPRVAVITNLVPDHLDWHSTFEDYRDAKAHIAARQEAGDLFVYPFAQPELSGLAPEPGPERVGLEPPTGDEMEVHVPGRTLRARGAAKLSARGRHFALDALAAATALAFLGAEAPAVEQALDSFRFAPHRLEPVGVRNGVRVVNDSVSTNPHATVAALRAVGGSLEGGVVLVAGGRNKGLDLSPLASEVASLKGVVAIGEAAEEIARTYSSVEVTVKTVGSMNEAVGVALDWAVEGDVVLLSPACASHDMFSGYADRGRAFLEACEALEVRA